MRILLLPGDAERVESESPGKEPRVGDNKWPTQPAKPVGLGIPPLFWYLAVILGGKDLFEKDGAWDGVQCCLLIPTDI